jgi:2-polyprenyl-3-methyl-5-hydroxy-6-metoxy-1,4-benzoquinol methylase
LGARSALETKGMLMNRNCEICDSKTKETLITVSFISPEKHNKKALSYDVVSCRDCGFLYANNIPTQDQMNEHYRASSKYTYNANIPNGLEKLHFDVFKAIKAYIEERYPFLNKDEFRIVDIGCSIGFLLNLFKENGFKKLIGIEPSKACCLVAKRAFGLSMFNGAISEYEPKTKFHLIMLSGVLEHIQDLHSTMPQILKLLDNDGTIVVAVPNADEFSKKPKAPFDEFSIEHINFFTTKSLTALMENIGLIRRKDLSIPSTFYDSNMLVAFFEKAPKKAVMDYSGKKHIQEYIDVSNAKLKNFEKKLDKIIANKQEIVIWGTGSLTSRLLANTNLSKVKISAFLDSNKELCGKTIHDISIESPEYLSHNDVRTIFIGSFIYKDEIKKQLINKYNYKGKIITI